MKTIYKYPLEIKTVQGVMMPKGAEILTVQLQRQELCVWAMVDTDAPMEEKLFAIRGTGSELTPECAIDGEPIALPRAYIGTVQIGALVVHVFQLLDPIEGMIRSVLGGGWR